MAFLDNSGDIILDAVLTDLGREKMAAGDFSVKYFALGDDEIDYALYNKNHPSGSAYYDLEILQTPVFEAFTQTNSSINYGLLDTTATDLLYMPIIKINDKSIDVLNQYPSTTAGSIGIVWVTDSQNDNSGGTTITAFERITNGGATNTALENSCLKGDSTNRFVFVEAGLNTTAVKGTEQNIMTYIAAMGLAEMNYNVYYDSRFIRSVYGNTLGDSFKQDSTGEADLTRTAKVATGTSLNSGLENFSSARVVGMPNLVLYNTSFTTPDTDISVIAGPRAGAVTLAVEIVPTLDTEYTLYGTLGSTSVLPGGQSLDYIDTTLYVQGRNTGIMMQIPLRIARIP